MHMNIHHHEISEYVERNNSPQKDNNVKTNTQKKQTKTPVRQKYCKPTQKVKDKLKNTICNSYHNELISLKHEELLKIKKKKPSSPIQIVSKQTDHRNRNTNSI